MLALFCDDGGPGPVPYRCRECIYAFHGTDKSVPYGASCDGAAGRETRPLQISKIDDWNPVVRCNNLNFTFQVTYGILKEKAKGVYHNVKQRDLFNRRRTAPS